MMLRWLTTAVIGLLFVLNLALPYTGVGRRGTEAAVRRDVAQAVGQVGERLPADLTFEDLDGNPVRLADLLGHRVVLTFERSVDW